MIKQPTSKAKATKILAVLKQSLEMEITKMHPNYFSQYEDFRNTKVQIINKAVSESKLRELLCKEIEANKRAIEIFRTKNQKKSLTVPPQVSKSQVANNSYLNKLSQYDSEIRKVNASPIVDRMLKINNVKLQLDRIQDLTCEPNEQEFKTPVIFHRKIEKTKTSTESILKNIMKTKLCNASYFLRKPSRPRRNIEMPSINENNEKNNGHLRFKTSNLKSIYMIPMVSHTPETEHQKHCFINHKQMRSHAKKKDVDSIRK